MCIYITCVCVCVCVCPWRRKWQPAPVFLPGESRGQRSLAGYSPWGCKELDMTEVLKHAFSIYTYTYIYTHTYITYSLCCTPETNTAL